MRSGKKLTLVMVKIIFAVLVISVANGLFVFLALRAASILKAKNRAIAEREVILNRYNWDGANREELLRRVMLYSNLSPEELGKHFSRQEMGKVFLENIHDFNKEKRKMWMNYLNIPEEEVERSARGKSKAPGPLECIR